jgi:glycosyltransferase involved in cell wall biosynthesis
VARRVAIACYELVPGRSGGTETYARSLADAISVEPAVHCTVAVSPLGRGALANGRVDELVLPAKPTVVQRLRRGLGLGPDFETTVAEQIDRHGFDVVHFPQSAIFPHGVRAPKVLSMMDIQHEYLPQFFSADEVEARRRVYRASLEEADRVIAISAFTKRTLVERYAVPTEKIAVVPLAYDPGLLDGEAGSIARPYLFYPAASLPHKNHGRLLEAFSRVALRHPGLQLVLSGMQERMTPELQASVARLGLLDRVLSLGYVPRDLLGAVYRDALALVYPSLFEGFGLPLVEAMATGTPVAASNVEAVAEVAGDAAILFDPEDVGSLVASNERLIGSADLRAELIERGRARAAEFSPERLAQRTLAVYETVALR